MRFLAFIYPPMTICFILKIVLTVLYVMIFYIIVYSWIYLFIYYLGILITTEHKGAFLFFVYLFVCPLVSLSVCLPVSPFVFWPFVCLFVC